MATKMAKHEYGDGSVYQRNDGRWVAKYTPVAGGKAKYLYGKTMTEVKRKLQAYKESPEVLLSLSPSTMLLSDYVQNWIRLYKQPAVRQATYDRIDSVYRNQIAPSFPQARVCDVTPDMCQRFIDAITRQGYSFAVVKKCYDILNGCFRHAVQVGDMVRNPMDVVRTPSASKFEQKEMRALTEDEERRLLDELFTKWNSGAYKYNYRYAFVVMLNTGLREGELVALDWSDVNFQKKTLRVRKTAVTVRSRDAAGNVIKGSKFEIQKTPKTKSGNRTISLNTKALEAFSELKKAYPDSPYVLTTKTGKRTCVSTLQKQLRAAAQAAGVDGVTPHVLRHTFATRLFQRGADVKSVSTLLGHSGIGITLNTYVHVTTEQQQATVALLE